MSDLQKLYDRAMAGYNAAILEQQSALQSAFSTGDMDAQVVATQTISNLERDRNDYHAMAVRHVESQKPRPPAPMPGEEDLSRGDVALCRKHQISPHELAIAKNWTSNPNLSADDKVAAYIKNRGIYRQARADGSYRDDQGTVTRG